SCSHFTQVQHWRAPKRQPREGIVTAETGLATCLARSQFTDRKGSVRLLLAAEVKLEHDVTSSDEIDGARERLSFILGIHGPTTRRWIEEEVGPIGDRFDQLVPLQIFDCHLHASGALRVTFAGEQ